MRFYSIDDFTIIPEDQKAPQKRPLITDAPIDTSDENFQKSFEKQLEEESQRLNSKSNGESEANESVKRIRPAIDLSDF